MKKSGLLLLILLFLTSTAFAYDNGDWQAWGTFNAAGNLADDWEITLEEELRYGDSATELYYHHADIGFTHKVESWFYLGINYRQVFELKSGAWTNESRPHLNGIFKWKLAGFKIEDRNRVEYRVREGKTETWRYRNKISFVFPFKWDLFEFQPYLADEIFVDTEGEGLDRNRFYAGVKGAFTETLKSEFFYLWQASKSGDAWPGINAIGLKLKAVF